MEHVLLLVFLIASGPMRTNQIYMSVLIALRNANTNTKTKTKKNKKKKRKEKYPFLWTLFRRMLRKGNWKAPLD